MKDARAFPNGLDWKCSRCNTSYPETYQGDRCKACHGPLTRVMLTFKL